MRLDQKVTDFASKTVEYDVENRSRSEDKERSVTKGVVGATIVGRRLRPQAQAPVGGSMKTALGRGGPRTASKRVTKFEAYRLVLTP